ncbi:stalk domain-containing protein [Paenibacillus sp. 32352]|uniref:stalk domain-containing protein n=1 Tax=Paenibacillus sp. 32352 TaxID=1969111 RepID=UPI0021176837|nr:stalk domain-containing protein [Paenibacillus sp. 32352]
MNFKGKRLALIPVIVVLLTLLFSLPAAAEEPVKIFVDTTKIAFQVEPQIIEGTTLVQFRPLFETMGMEVKWDEIRQQVTGSRPGLSIALTINDSKADVNGKQVELSQSAQIIDGSTMVPLRFIGEATGAIVHWDEYTREIQIITDAFLKQVGMSKEEVQRRLAEYDAKQAKQHATQDTPTGQETTPAAQEPTPPPPAAASEPVDLSNLSGMYYGLRDDFGGFECGGACWDMYTFLPDNHIFVGPPPQGGPETIDCSRDGCSTYTIANGKLQISANDIRSIHINDRGELVINDVDMSPIAAVPEGTKLKGTYQYIGYSGLVGINASSSSWTEYLSFSGDGTFQSTDLTLSSLNNTVSSTNATGSKSDKGTYDISGNTITLTYKDGTVVRSVFFFHDNYGKDSFRNIQIGQNRFYIPKEN